MALLQQKLKTLLCAHYITNLLLATSYFLLKVTPFVCEYVYESCELEWREMEILMLLCIFVAVKSRKSPSFNVFVNTLFTFSKVANVVLYWREGPIYVFTFCLFWFLHFVFIPQPAYKGPSNIEYFRANHLQDTIERDTRITWVVCFFASWSPPCTDLEPIFAEVSNRYGGLKTLKFAKFDCNLYPDFAAKQGVSTSPISKQLPTIIMYQNGKETKRRPHVTSNGSVYKFIFSYDNIVKDFDLNKVFYDCGQVKVDPKPLPKAETSKEEKKTN